jgi:radical SAM superfamily enzyme YgiQ (UPF0313 family)
LSYLNLRINISETLRIKKHMNPSNTSDAFKLEDEGMSNLNLEDVVSCLGRKFPSKKISRVLLVTPPDGTAKIFQKDTARRRRYTNYPPYGLGVIAHHLMNSGIDTAIINLNHAILKEVHSPSKEESFDFDEIWQANLADKIESFEPDLIGITCMFTMSHDSLKWAAQFCSNYEIPVAVGGVHVTNDVERVLDDIIQIDFAFTNEAEIALERFCKVVNKEISVDQLRQVIINDKGKRYRFDELVRPNEDEISIMPAYELIEEISDYSKYGVIGNFHGFRSSATKFSTVLSNRGCRAQCTFCSVRNFNGVGVRQRSVASVLDELEFLRYEHGIEHIMWLDDDLLKDKRRAIDLFNGIVKRGIEITWDATNGLIASSCTMEVVSAMAESGFIAGNIGMESGNPEILRKIRKPGAVKTFLRAAEVFHQFPQLHIRVFLIIGFPGETLGMIRDTYDVARNMDMDWYAITTLQPLPNTPIYDSMVAQGLVQEVGGDVRFNSGGYGKQQEVEKSSDNLSILLSDFMSDSRKDDIPTDNELTDLWFLLNYTLNFERLFTEDRTEKIKQQMMNLRSLCDVISPEHALALYFLCVLEHRLNGKIDKSTVDRLEDCLATSEYWSTRFDAVGLKVDEIYSIRESNVDLSQLQL